MVCKKCGAELLDGTEVCGNCGEVQDLNPKEVQEVKPEAEQVTNDLSEKEAEEVQPKKSKSKIGIIAGIVVSLAVLIVGGIYAKGYMHYLAIKNDPIGAYKDATVKTRTLDSLKNQVSLKFDLEDQNQSYNIELICNSTVDNKAGKGIHDLKLNVKSGSLNYSVGLKAYQKDNKLYLEVPKSQKYICISNVSTKNTDKNYTEMSDRILDKITDEVNKKIKKDDIDVSNEDTAIGDKNVSAVKTEFKISDQTAKSLLKNIAKAIISDKEVQKMMKQSNKNLTQQQIDTTLNSIDEKFDTAMKEIKIEDAKAISYIDKDGYPVKSEFKGNLVPSAGLNETGKISLDIKSVLKDKNGDYKINIPNDLSSKAVNIEDLMKNSTDSQQLLSQFLSQFTGLGAGNQSY